MFDIIKSLITPDFVGRMVRTAIQTGLTALSVKLGVENLDPAGLAAAAGVFVSLIWTHYASKKAEAKLEQAIEAPAGMAVTPGVRPV